MMSSKKWLIYTHVLVTQRPGYNGGFAMTVTPTLGDLMLVWNMWKSIFPKHWFSILVVWDINQDPKITSSNVSKDKQPWAIVHHGTLPNWSGLAKSSRWSKNQGEGWVVEMGDTFFVFSFSGCNLWSGFLYFKFYKKSYTDHNLHLNSNTYLPKIELRLLLSSDDCSIQDCLGQTGDSLGIPTEFILTMMQSPPSLLSGPPLSFWQHPPIFISPLSCANHSRSFYGNMLTFENPPFPTHCHFGNTIVCSKPVSSVGIFPIFISPLFHANHFRSFFGNMLSFHHENLPIAI